MSELTDKQLLKAFTSQQDEAAFSELVARHCGMTKRVCWRLLGNEQDAEDCVQAVFMVLARRARLVVWHSSIANWLYGAAWRIANRELRRRPRVPRQEYDMNQHPESPAKVVDSIEDQLYPAIYELPARYREAVVLCYLEGKSRQMASQELGASESVLKGRLERSKHLLRKKLSANRDELLDQLSAGAVVTLVSQSNISAASIDRICQNAFGYALSNSAAGVSAVSRHLAHGESFNMFYSAQLKIGLALLGIACTLVVIGYFVNESTAVTPATTTVESNSTTEINEKELATKRHLQAILQAMHVYADDHEGRLPPATIPNAKLPIEKRLSGFVAILPYLGIRPSYIDASNKDWATWHADNARAKALFAKIDLTKAWDDPANAEAAKSIVPEFLSPLENSTTDARGYALTHFAMVRGGMNRDNGMFPLSGKQDLAFVDVADGTTVTAAVGQVHDKPGPWIAGGESTARFLNAPSPNATPNMTKAGFGSPHPGLAYFANGDSTVYCLDLETTPPAILNKLSGRDDKTLLDMSELHQFPSFTDALNSKRK